MHIVTFDGIPSAAGIDKNNLFPGALVFTIGSIDFSVASLFANPSLSNDVVLKPEWSKFCLTLGNYYLKKGERDKAAIYYQRVPSDCLGFGEAFYRLATSYLLEEQNYTKAHFFYQKIDKHI